MILIKKCILHCTLKKLSSYKKHEECVEILGNPALVIDVLVYCNLYRNYTKIEYVLFITSLSC